MRLTVDSFGGQVEETVFNKDKLIEYQSTENTITIPKLNCSDSQNVDLYPKGDISSRKGYDKLDTSVWHSSAIIKLYQGQLANGKDYLLAFSASAAGVSADIATVTFSSGDVTFSSCPTGSSVSNWAPSANDVISIDSYSGSAVFSYEGGSHLLAYGGSAVCNTITAAPSGAKCVAAWGGFLFVGNIIEKEYVGANGDWIYVRRKSRVRWCQVTSLTTWPTSYYVDLDKDDSDEITCLKVLGDNIIAFKKYKTFVGKWVGGTLIFDFVRQDLIGCIGPNAVTESDGLLYYLSYRDVRVFDGSSPSSAISLPIEQSLRSINALYRETTEAAYYEPLDQIFFSVPQGSSTIKNRIYVYDKLLKEWNKHTLSIASIESKALYMTVLPYTGLTYADFPDIYSVYDTLLGAGGGGGTTPGELFMLFGTYDGYLLRFGSLLNDSDIAIDSSWTSPWIDLGMPDYNKRLIKITFILEKKGNYDLNIDLYRDWEEDIATTSLTTTMSGFTNTIEKRVHSTLPFRALKFKIGTNSVYTSFKVHKIIFDILVKGRTLVS
jgi:hypothetical protein